MNAASRLRPFCCTASRCLVCICLHLSVLLVRVLCPERFGESATAVAGRAVAQARGGKYILVRLALPGQNICCVVVFLHIKARLLINFSSVSEPLTT